MTHPADPLPLLPVALLGRYHCAEPTGTRFRAVARLRQSLWREEQGWVCTADKPLSAYAAAAQTAGVIST